ncbi:MAG: rhomboid family intramembrane serine protease [Kofleriaceae bacterium]
MLYETALLWVAISGGYWGLFLFRRRAYQSSTFPTMLIAAAVCSLLGLLGRDEGSAALSAFGAVGLGGGICVLLVGPLARRLARRAHQAERWRIAWTLYEIAEVLQPGTGVREERQRLQSGDVREAVERLTSVREGVPTEARRLVDERIALMYLLAGQWAQAVDFIDETLLPPRAEGELPSFAQLPVALRVELIGAYGFLDRLEWAGLLLEQLELEGQEEARMAPVLFRARLMFLALCGRVEAVRQLLRAARRHQLPRWTVHYWLGVAADRAGDRALATSELRRAAATGRGSARRVAEAALADSERDAPARAPLSEATTTLAARAAERPAPTWATEARPWATVAACGVIVAVTLATIAAGGAAEISVLVRAGAVARGLVEEGQWWRLATAVFLHVGVTHAAVNLLALWVIGRLAESVFGALRASALFAACGVAGAALGCALSIGGISAGASGAIFGLLGAVFGEFTFHRERLAAAVRTGLWGALAVVSLATFALGTQVPEVDQWAHVGGLIAGLALGQLLSPRRRFASWSGGAAWFCVVAFAALLAWGAWGIWSRDFATTLLGGPRRVAQLGELAVVAPQRWRLDDGALVDPDGFVVLTAHTAALPEEAAAPEPWAAWRRGELERARELSFETAAEAERTQVHLGQAWQVSEAELSISGASGRRAFRVLTFGRRLEDEWILGSLYAPQSLFDAAAPELARIVGTLAPRE